MRTRGLSREEAETRVDAQPPAEEKVAQADVVIDNSGSLQDTHAQVLSAWRTIPGAGTAGALEPGVRRTT